MNDAFGKIVAVFISVYLMFIAPVIFMEKEVTRLEDSYVLTETSIFIENVKNTGIISKEEFDLYFDKIAALDSLYTLEIVHSKHRYNYESGNISFLENNYFLDDITKDLNNNGIYYLNETDYLKITVYRDSKPVVFVGGGVKNEAY